MLKKLRLRQKIGLLIKKNVHVPNVGISNAGEVEEKEELKTIVGNGLFW